MSSQKFGIAKKAYASFISSRPAAGADFFWVLKMFGFEILKKKNADSEYCNSVEYSEYVEYFTHSKYFDTFRESEY